MPSHLLRDYPDRPTALRASNFLLDEGVLARAQDEHTGRRTLPGLTTGHLRHWVAIAFEADRDHATALLDEFDATPPPPDPGPEDQPIPHDPDLTLLAAGVTVPCVQCRYDLRPLVRADPAVRCPECGCDNDAVQRILARHGPEALIDCYPQDDPDDGPDAPHAAEDAALARLHLPCPHCACPLHALPPAGPCPACGKPYDKRAIVRHAFDAL